MVVQVIVCGVDGAKITIDLCQNERDLHLISVVQLKKKISEKLPGSPDKAMADMKLIFATTRLDDDHKLLSEYGIIHKSVIQMVLRLDGGLAV